MRRRGGGRGRITVAALGVIDILVNNAGVVATASLPRTELAAFERQIAVNLTGAFLLMRALVPAMVARGFGRVVNVASTAAHRGYPYAAAYCASKHGLLGLTRAAGLELARTGVTVNAVSPGYTETPLLEGSIRAAAAATRRTPDAVRASFLEDNPMGRFVEARGGRICRGLALRAATGRDHRAGDHARGRPQLVTTDARWKQMTTSSISSCATRWRP